jgi:heme-degrading monooxygenase HmoA
MKLYITYGTVDYLAKLLKKHPDKKLRLMANNDTAVLLHETKDASIFNAPKKYDVLDSKGELSNGSYAVFNNIPVSFEGRPLYEKRFSDRARLIEKQPGFSAIRVLRPDKNDTYIILTLWKNEQSFNTWHESIAGIEEQSTFPRPSYLTKYTSVKIDD